MRKRDRRRAARRLHEEQTERRRAARQAHERAAAEVTRLLDPVTPVQETASYLLNMVDSSATAARVVHVMTRKDWGWAGRVADAALRLDDGVVAHTLAAEVALLDQRAGEAKEHLDRALAMSDAPALRLRLAVAQALLGRPGAGVAILDELLAGDPLDAIAQQLRGSMLESLQEHGDQAADACPCGSGQPYAGCCRGEDQVLIDRFRDREPLHEVRRAVEAFESRPEIRVLARAARQGWTAVTGVEGEAARTEEAMARLMDERAWALGTMLDGRSVLQALAADPATPRALGAWTRSYGKEMMWGLWQLGRATGSPGVPVCELITGLRLYVEIPPEQLAGVARWSVMFGYLVSIDGIWHSGGSLVPLSPQEACGLGRTILDSVARWAAKQGTQGSEVSRWALDTRRDLVPTRLPETVRRPPPRGATPLLGSVTVIDLPDHLEQVRRGRAAQAAPGHQGEDGRQEWLDRPLRALDGLTPREAAGREELRHRLEAELRLFEHQLDSEGLSGPDTAPWREELGLTGWLPAISDLAPAGTTSLRARAGLRSPT